MFFGVEWRTDSLGKNSLLEGSNVRSGWVVMTYVLLKYIQFTRF